MLAKYSGATIEFLANNMTQMIRHSAVRTPSQPCRRPEVLKTAAQQDETIRGIAATEEEQLDAQQEGMVESDPSDSLDMTTAISLRCLHNDMTIRLLALV